MNRSLHQDPEEWVKRVNRRWIVRNGLAESAAAWLDYLHSCGNGRAMAACEAAWRMTWMRGSAEDPKPWFYAGLFSGATAEEARRFLADHALTAAAVAPESDPLPPELSASTAGLVERLRRSISLQCGR